LLEILIVLAIMSLVLAVVLPRIGRLPKRLAVENAQSAVRLAVVEVGMRARASGRPLRLILDVDEGCFLVESMPSESIGGSELQPSPLGPAGMGAEEQAGHILSTLSRYEIPPGVEWRLDLGGAEDLVDEEGRPVYAFYPSGEATGSPAVFTVAGRTFELDVDRLTGRPIIRDLDAGT
jgi:type II secretory pathway pseudopilin PulG